METERERRANKDVRELDLSILGYFPTDSALSICAVDLSYRATGVAALVGGRVVALWLLKREGMSKAEYRRVLAEFLADLVGKCRFDALVFERPFFSARTPASIELFGLLVTVVDACRDKVPSIRLLPPASWRARLGLPQSPREKAKLASIALVQDHFRVKVAADVADAICVGLALAEGEQGEDGCRL